MVFKERFRDEEITRDGEAEFVPVELHRHANGQWGVTARLLVGLRVPDGRVVEFDGTIKMGNGKGESRYMARARNKLVEALKYESFPPDVIELAKAIVARGH
jgi:hypothetical protein